MTLNELLAYAREQYGTEPEYLWESAPNTFVLRHRGNRKWYAVVMDVRRDRLGLPGEEIVYIMDVKCDPLLSGSYIGKPGVVPAYHMNKTHWLGVLLDGSAADETVTELLDLSYGQTQSRKPPASGIRPMKIEHIALYVNDLEAAKNFFVTCLGGRSNEGYHNKTTDFRSYFISFDDGARLELMNRPGMTDDAKAPDRTGYAHVAFSVGSKEKVDELTARLKADGYEVVSGPRTTGDGYYESCVIAIEGNQIEITE